MSLTERPGPVSAGPSAHGFCWSAPRWNHADGCERTLDCLGRAPIAPAEVVGPRDDQVLGDAGEKFMREVPRLQTVVRAREGREVERRLFEQRNVGGTESNAPRPPCRELGTAADGRRTAPERRPARADSTVPELRPAVHDAT